jgi:hypothetical protein
MSKGLAVSTALHAVQANVAAAISTAGSLMDALSPALKVDAADAAG